MASSSNSRAEDHQVFISFNWDETRYTFVSHLSAALRREGISTALSDAADVKSNESAIERSWLSVVVFSENFASSVSCLNTLHSVTRLKHKTRQLILPVFYRVSRSDVEKQKGSFEKAFTLHQKSHLSAQLTKWRKALAEAAASPRGHESDDNHSEALLVENIVADVREILDSTGKFGINRMMVELEHFLRKQHHNIGSLGIWGMGGIGKTTLAEAAFERMRARFDASCLISSFDQMFKEKGLYGLREDAFAEIFGGEDDIISSITKPDLFRDKLRHRTLLVVLDDVQSPLDAESFLGGFHSFAPGSVMIITSRDRQVLLQCRVNHIYEVKGLSERESRQVFSRLAYGKDQPDKGMEELTKKVIQYASGNPLALSIYADMLKRKKPNEVETALLNLEQHLPRENLNKFRSSYDALEDNEKNIFLDIVCFFLGEKTDSVMKILEGCGLFPRVGIDVLVDKSLMTISEERLEMHNLVRAFGLRMTNDERVKMARGRRLWEPKTIRSLLQHKETKKAISGSEDIKGIVLDTSRESFTVNSMAFENMYSLRLLKIYNSPGLSLTKGLRSLPAELRILHWEHYPLESLPNGFDPSHLVELNMPHSQLRTLWEGTDMNLSMLKTIKLSESYQLVEIFELSKARNLETLDLHGCIGMQSLPRTVDLQHLKVVNLSGCRGITSFPEVPPKLRELYVNATDLREVPDSIEDHSELVKLDVGNCKELLNVSGNIWKLKSLKHLHLSGCSKLESFPTVSEIMESLEHLDLSETAIADFPSPMENLSGLRFLGLENCRNLPEMSDEMKETMKNLELKFGGNTEASSFSS